MAAGLRGRAHAWPYPSPALMAWASLLREPRGAAAVPGAGAWAAGPSGQPTAGGSLQLPSGQGKAVSVGRGVERCGGGSAVLPGRRTRRALRGEERDYPLPTHRTCSTTPKPGLDSAPRQVVGLKIAPWPSLIPTGLVAMQRRRTLLSALVSP